MLGVEAAAGEERTYPPITTIHLVSGTHVFNPDSKWAEVWVTGGGGRSASTADGVARLGSGGGTAIKTFIITQPSATIVVAQRKYSQSDGDASSYNDGVNIMQGNGGSSNHQNGQGGLASGGDLNIPGGAAGYVGTNSNGNKPTSGGSFWGDASYDRFDNHPAVVWGSAGGRKTGYGDAPGEQGVVVIKEYR